MAKNAFAKWVDGAIEKEIAGLESTWVHVETNQGTFGSTECLRKCGTGETRYGNRDVYETPSGKRRATGPEEADAPGRMRQINTDRIVSLRKLLNDYRKQLAK